MSAHTNSRHFSSFGWLSLSNVTNKNSQIVAHTRRVFCQNDECRKLIYHSIFSIFFLLLLALPLDPFIYLTRTCSYACLLETHLKRCEYVDSHERLYSQWTSSDISHLIVDCWSKERRRRQRRRWLLTTLSVDRRARERKNTRTHISTEYVI